MKNPLDSITVSFIVLGSALLFSYIKCEYMFEKADPLTFKSELDVESTQSSPDLSCDKTNECKKYENDLEKNSINKDLEDNTQPVSIESADKTNEEINLQVESIDSEPNTNNPQKTDGILSDKSSEEILHQEKSELNEDETVASDENKDARLEIVGQIPTQQKEDKIKEDSVFPKRKIFPLLYTLKTLISSFITEFSDEGISSESSINQTRLSDNSSSLGEELVQDSNSTTNASDVIKKTRFQCALKNLTENQSLEVKIVNSTELLEILSFSKSQKVSPCVIVMFYAPWCHFCAKAAPHYNALARAFPQLDVLAVDTSHFSYLNARFGTVAVPNIMLFHSRSAVRFNHTSRVLENFITFIKNNTGLEPNSSVGLLPEDYIGPQQSIVEQGRDWLLWLAWFFVISCSIYGFFRSHYGQTFILRVRVLWLEHQHIE